MNTDRREIIKQLVAQKGQISLRELERMHPELSSMTLRRDLIALEDEGFLIRTRGGAVSKSKVLSSAEAIYSHRAEANVEAKMIIATKALTLVEAGRSLFIDSGTTTMCFARVLPDENLYVITSGPNIAMQLTKNANISCVMVGGNLNRNNLSVSGMQSVEFIRGLNIDMAFLVASGYEAHSGFTCGTYSECELKREVVHKARRRILLMDSSKVNKSMPFTFANSNDIDVLVTDGQMPEQIMESFRSLGVVVM